MNLTDRVLFPGSAWWLLLLVPLVFLGFYPTYFSLSAAPVPGVLHLHSVLMMGWLLMAVAQPLLVARKQLKAHRFIGKLSYLLMPLLLVSGWWVVQWSYAGSLARMLPVPVAEASPVQLAEAAVQARAGTILPVVFLAFLALFFALAVWYRKKVVFHATFMFAATLTLLGPSVDRLLFRVYHLLGIGINLFAEVATFLLTDLLLLLVLFFQWRHKYPLTAVCWSLAIYLTGQAAILWGGNTAAWQMLIGWLL